MKNEELKNLEEEEQQEEKRENPLLDDEEVEEEEEQDNINEEDFERRLWLKRILKYLYITIILIIYWNKIKA